MRFRKSRNHGKLGSARDKICKYTTWMNYNQIFFRFCATSTTIVVLGIATRRWRCRTVHRLEIVANLDWISRSKTRKNFITYLLRIFVHLLGVDMPSRWYPFVLHERWLVYGHVSHEGVRLRVSRYCCPASSNDLLLRLNRMRFFLIYISVLECALECCAHTPHVSRRRVQRLRHHVPEPSTHMSRTSDSNKLEAHCEIKDPNSSKPYFIVLIHGGFWRFIARCREFSLQPAVTQSIFRVHGSTFTMLFVGAFTDRV